MFTLNKDPERGIETVGWFEDDGRMTVQVRQYIPDHFIAGVHAMRDFQQRKHHMQLAGVIPDAVLQEALKDSDGKQLDSRDPERQKRIRRLLNDNEFHKFKVRDGVI